MALKDRRIVLLQPTIERREPARARYLLLQLLDDTTAQSSTEVVIPSEAPEAGFEDPRLFTWRGRLWCCARVSAPAKDGEAMQVLTCVDDQGPGPIRLPISVCCARNGGICNTGCRG